MNGCFRLRYQYSKNRTTFWMESNSSHRQSTSNRRDMPGNQSTTSKSNARESTSSGSQTKQKKFNRKFKGNSMQMETD